MHVAMVGEGTYPHVRGGVSTWSDQLVRGLPEVDYSVVALTAGRPQRAYPAAANLREVQAIDMWSGEPESRWVSGRQRRQFLESWEVICEHCLDGEPSSATALEAWLELATAPLAGRLWSLITDRSALQVLEQARMRTAGRAYRPATAKDLALVSAYLARVISPLAVGVGDVDAVHVTSSGSSVLAALGWVRDGVPVVLSEHGVFLRERLIALRETPWSPVSRSVVAAFLKGITRVGYEAATVIAPVSDFNGRWAASIGAPPSRISTVYNGVDTERFRPVAPEPPEPVVVFVGRVDPLKDLGTMIESVAIARRAVPDVRLDIIGPVPPVSAAYAESLRGITQAAGLADRVRFLGPTDDPVRAYASGQVVALSSVSEGFPYGALEAMAVGRPVVATSVGGVPECVGDAGILVRSKDPEAFADGLVTMLGDSRERQDLGRLARARVEEQFTLDRMLRRFRSMYTNVVRGSSLVVEIPAQRQKSDYALAAAAPRAAEAAAL